MKIYKIAQTNNQMSFTPQQGADIISKMTPEQIDNLNPSDAPGGDAAYLLYEARKLKPKVHGKFKRINDNNSFRLWTECNYVVNINGFPILASLYDDPDAIDVDEEDEEKEGYRKGKVFAFFRPENTSDVFESSWSSYEDSIQELLQNKPEWFA